MLTISIPEAKELVRHIAIGMNEPVMFWGAPGVGKSEAIAQVVEEMDGILIDIRLSQYDSVDLRGFPGVDEETKLTTWHAPATLPFVGNKNFPTDKIITIFFDEINAATNPVAAVAYQIVNDRRCGEHVLMPNVRIVAAGNRESDRGVTNKQPLPLSNRFTHAEIGLDHDAWCFHIQSIGLPAIGAAFIQFRKPLLSTFEQAKENGHKAFATPRTWVKALKYFADTTMPNHVKRIAMSGAIGDGPATEFWGFTEIWQKMPSMASIEKNPTKVDVPIEAGMMYAVSVAISGTMNVKNIHAFQLYLDRMNPEFNILAWQLATRRDEALYTTPEFIQIAKKFKAVFQAGR